jgi:hypothetical protein
LPVRSILNSRRPRRMSCTAAATLSVRVPICNGRRQQHRQHHHPCRQQQPRQGPQCHSTTDQAATAAPVHTGVTCKSMTHPHTLHSCPHTSHTPCTHPVHTLYTPGPLTFGLGMSPLGPRMRPSLTRTFIMSGVAMQASKAMLFPLSSSSCSARAAPPMMSAPGAIQGCGSGRGELCVG